MIKTVLQTIVCVLGLSAPSFATTSDWFDVSNGGSQPTTTAACDALATASPTARVGALGVHPGVTIGWCATNGANDDNSAIFEVIRRATLIITPDALNNSGAGRVFLIKCQYPTINDFWCKKVLVDTNADGLVNATDDVAYTGEPGVNGSQSKFVWNLDRGWYFLDFCESGHSHGYCHGEDGTGGTDGVVPASSDLYVVTVEGND